MNISRQVVEFALRLLTLKIELNFEFKSSVFLLVFFLISVNSLNKN